MLTSSPLPSKVFALINIFLGSFLVLANVQIDANLKDCTSQTLRNCNKLLLIIATIMITASICYRVCIWKNINLIYIQSSIETGLFYIWLFLTLGLVLITISSLMIDQAKDKSNNCKGALTWAVIVLVLAIFIVLYSAFLIWFYSQI